MPEGHTLHRLAGALNAAYAGTVPEVSSPQGRFASGASMLGGRRFVEASAWGKHLFVEFAGEAYLHVHLGLIGTFEVTAYDGYAGLPPPQGQVRLRMVGSGVVADLRGATLCEVVTPEQVDDVVSRLGPDPLRADADPEPAWQRVHSSNRMIGELLMDQAVLAGVGNVFRCEVLFRHRIDPVRPGRQLRRSTWDSIWQDLLLLMPIGVRLGQIVTMADQVDDAVLGAYDAHAVPALGGVVSAWRPNPQGALERRFYVYQRQGQPCHVCGSRVRSRVLAGRNLYWCGRCQRRR
ncbi:MAG: Fpg/Nei family DNA glycosylase [Dermatophilaceae bacterium]